MEVPGSDGSADKNCIADCISILAAPCLVRPMTLSEKCCPGMPRSQVGHLGCFLRDALHQATATEAEDKVLKEQSHSVVDHESRDAHEGPTYLRHNPLCMAWHGNWLLITWVVTKWVGATGGAGRCL